MVTSLKGVSVSCQCACSEELNPIATAAVGATSEVLPLALPADGPDSLLGQLPAVSGSDLSQEVIDVDSSSGPRRLREKPDRGIVSYVAELHRPLIGSPLRVGEVWHLHDQDAKSLEPATLSLYANGFEVQPDNGGRPTIVSWSPFSLVQACRLHSVQADAALPWLRLFKVSVFHHGAAHHFAARNEDLEASQRARWVADVARALRMLTASLFPPFRIRSEPVSGAVWTSTRLVAGYLLMCDNQDVALVYCELHCHWDQIAAFAVYEDEYCDTRVMHVSLGVHTCISERVGIDCSCFSVDGHHFSARSSAEKAFWLRAVSNVKVKLRHRAENPSPLELRHYRSSVADCARLIRDPETAPKPLLTRRESVHLHKLGLGAKSMKETKGKSNKDTQAPSEVSPLADSPKAKVGASGQMLGGYTVQLPSVPMTPCEAGGGSMPSSPSLPCRPAANVGASLPSSGSKPILAPQDMLLKELSDVLPFAPMQESSAPAQGSGVTFPCKVTRKNPRSQHRSKAEAIPAAEQNAVPPLSPDLGN